MQKPQALVISIGSYISKVFLVMALVVLGKPTDASAKKNYGIKEKRNANSRVITIGKQGGKRGNTKSATVATAKGKQATYVQAGVGGNTTRTAYH